jgi:hypothetical protein
MQIQALGKTLLATGILLALTGLVLMGIHRIPFVGRLPGDLLIKKEHLTFYIPITTCLVLSLILTLLVKFFGKR